MSSFTVNRLVKRKLRLSIFFLGVYSVVHALVLLRPGLVEPAAWPAKTEELVLAAALINLLIVGLVNPLRADRVPDRFPSILQDAIVLGMLLLFATFVVDEKFLTTSAVSAV